VKENDSAPGDRPVRPRPYPGAAPAIPHGVSDFLPITKDQNACVDCHAVAQKKKGEPTPIPSSHFVDLRNAPEKRQEKVAGARWVCTACHVSQQDVAPLVKSPFPR
jgi:cytochrome c-type protein NapB